MKNIHPKKDCLDILAFGAILVNVTNIVNPWI